MLAGSRSFRESYKRFPWGLLVIYCPTFWGNKAVLLTSKSFFSCSAFSCSSWSAFLSVFFNLNDKTLQFFMVCSNSLLSDEYSSAWSSLETQNSFARISMTTHRFNLSHISTLLRSIQTKLTRNMGVVWAFKPSTLSYNYPIWWFEEELFWRSWLRI